LEPPRNRKYIHTYRYVCICIRKESPKSLYHGNFTFFFFFGTSRKRKKNPRSVYSTSFLSLQEIGSTYIPIGTYVFASGRDIQKVYTMELSLSSSFLGLRGLEVEVMDNLDRLSQCPVEANLVCTMHWRPFDPVGLPASLSVREGLTWRPLSGPSFSPNVKWLAGGGFE
jgi:hypothetical protein